MSEKRLASSGDSFVDLTEMQIVDLLNKLSDENTRLHKKVDEQQATIKKQDIEIQSLNLHIEKLVDGDEISQLLMREYERSDGLEKENEQLRNSMKELENVNLVIELRYNYGYGKYLADVRVVDDE